ncbi:MAG: hypothetical protein K6F33_14535 [Bacteroidales bacterium]|nr:hypothetical protein [Bacteroidales bacterium]
MNDYQKKDSDRYAKQDSKPPILLYVICGIVLVVALYIYIKDRNAQEAQQRLDARIVAEYDSLLVAFDAQIKDTNFTDIGDLESTLYYLDILEMGCSAQIGNRREVPQLWPEYQRKVQRVRAKKIAQNNCLMANEFFSIDFPSDTVYHEESGNVQQWYSDDFDYSVAYSADANTLQSQETQTGDLPMPSYETQQFLEMDKKYFEGMDCKLIEDRMYNLDSCDAKICYVQDLQSDMYFYYCATVAAGGNYVLMVRDRDHNPNRYSADEVDSNFVLPSDVLRFFDSFALVDADTVVLPRGNIVEYVPEQGANPEVEISTPSINTLYVGVKNLITITPYGVPASDIIMSFSGHGSIARKGDNEYIVLVKSEGECRLNVDAIVEGRNVHLCSKTFEAKKFPDPIAVIGTGANKRGGTISKSALMNASIKLESEYPEYDFKCSVVGFTVTAYINGFAESATSESGTLTSEQKKIISRVASGNSVYIRDIHAKDPDGTLRQLGTLSFVVK